MIDHGELLLTIAEIAVAFAAFSGLVSVLGRARPQIDPRLAANRLQSVLFTSLLATAFALFPFLPLALGVAEGAAWRISAGVFSIAWFIYTVSVFRRSSRLLRDGVERASVATPWTWVILPLYVTGFVALLVTAMGFFPAQIRVWELRRAEATGLTVPEVSGLTPSPFPKSRICLF